MPHFYGKQSEYIRHNQIKHVDLADYWRLFSLILILGILAVIYYGHKNIGIAGYIIIFVVLKFCDELILAKIKKHKKTTKQFRVGREGEREAGEVIKTLPEEFFVFQDLKIFNLGGNIDFAVLGPTGLFVLEVKSHSGRVGFNGYELTLNGHPFPEKNILNQAKREAATLADYLKQKLQRNVFIQPVLVFSGYAKMSFGLKPVNSVFVVGKSFLNQLITSRPQTFSQEQILKIENVLKGLVLT